jgi:hypothetical protein
MQLLLLLLPPMLLLLLLYCWLLHSFQCLLHVTATAHEHVLPAGTRLAQDPAG